MTITMSGSPSPPRRSPPTRERDAGLMKDQNGTHVSLQGMLYEAGREAGYVDEKQKIRDGLQTQVAQFEGQTAGLYDKNETITDFGTYAAAEEGANIAGRKMEGSGQSGQHGYHGIYSDIVREQSNELSLDDEERAKLQVDMDEHEQDLVDTKKAVATMLDTDGDGVVEEGERFSAELVTLFTHMNRYSSRYNVDLFRSLKENGGRFTVDGNGVMAKSKFTSVLLSSFLRMNTCFTKELLDEITLKFGCGPVDKHTGGYLDIKWRLFCNFVGERYLTFPPIS